MFLISQLCLFWFCSVLFFLNVVLLRPCLFLVDLTDLCFCWIAEHREGIVIGDVCLHGSMGLLSGLHYGGPKFCWAFFIIPLSLPCVWAVAQSKLAEIDKMESDD